MPVVPIPEGLLCRTGLRIKLHSALRAAMSEKGGRGFGTLGFQEAQARELAAASGFTRFEARLAPSSTAPPYTPPSPQCFWSYACPPPTPQFLFHLKSIRSATLVRRPSRDTPQILLQAAGSRLP